MEGVSPGGCPWTSHGSLCQCDTYGPPTESQSGLWYTHHGYPTDESIFDNLGPIAGTPHCMFASRTPFPPPSTNPQQQGHATPPREATEGPSNAGEKTPEQPQSSTATPSGSKRRKPTPAQVRRLRKNARFEGNEDEERETGDEDIPPNEEEEAERKRQEEADRLIAEQVQAELERERTRTAQTQRSGEELEREREEARKRNDERRKKFRFVVGAPWERAPPPPQVPPPKRKYKYRPGTVALREIRKYQKSTEPIIPKAPFARICKEIIDECSDSVTRVQANALGALQQATEDIAVSLFQDGVLCHAHAKRVTLKTVDLALAIRLREEYVLVKNHM